MASTVPDLQLCELSAASITLQKLIPVYFIDYRPELQGTVLYPAKSVAISEGKKPPTFR